MTTAPQWTATDEQTGSLLDLLADDGSPILSPTEEWFTFVGTLRIAALGSDADVIDPNRLRGMLREAGLTPHRVGPFTRRAVLAGFVEYTGNWVISDDAAGKNSGKPCRELRWVGPR